MNAPMRSGERPRGDAAGDVGPVGGASNVAAVRADLARRWREVDDEIRHYPTPIARCDVQLTALIELRDELRMLRALDDAQLVAAYADALVRWAPQ